MENGTVQKGQNLLEDFVWPIDTGRLMGDPSYYSYPCEQSSDSPLTPIKQTALG